MARPSIDVVVPPQVKEVLESMAKEQQTGKTKVYASDIVRQAIQEFLTSRGIDMPVEVDRGGWRGEAKDKQQ